MYRWTGKKVQIREQIPKIEQGITKKTGRGRGRKTKSIEPKVGRATLPSVEKGDRKSNANIKDPEEKRSGASNTEIDANQSFEAENADKDQVDEKESVCEENKIDRGAKTEDEQLLTKKTGRGRGRKTKSIEPKVGKATLPSVEKGDRKSNANIKDPEEKRSGASNREIDANQSFEAENADKDQVDEEESEENKIDRGLKTENEQGITKKAGRGRGRKTKSIEPKVGRATVPSVEKGDGKSNANIKDQEENHPGRSNTEIDANQSFEAENANKDKRTKRRSVGKLHQTAEKEVDQNSSSTTYIMTNNKNKISETDGLSKKRSSRGKLPARYADGEENVKKDQEVETTEEVQKIKIEPKDSEPKDPPRRRGRPKTNSTKLDESPKVTVLVKTEEHEPMAVDINSGRPLEDTEPSISENSPREKGKQMLLAEKKMTRRNLVKTTNEESSRVTSVTRNRKGKKESTENSQSNSTKETPPRKSSNIATVKIEPGNEEITAKGKRSARGQTKEKEKINDNGKQNIEVKSALQRNTKRKSDSVDDDKLSSTPAGKKFKQNQRRITKTVNTEPEESKSSQIRGRKRGSQDLESGDDSQENIRVSKKAKKEIENSEVESLSSSQGSRRGRKSNVKVEAGENSEIKQVRRCF